MDLGSFLKQNYQIVLTQISDEDGGGWLAEIPDLKGCVSDGATPVEALQNLKDAQSTWYTVATKRGLSIPAPLAKEDEYSGKFTLRVPKSLHRDLAGAAEREGISLNQYLLSLLSYGFGRKQSSFAFESSVKLSLSGLGTSRLEELDPDMLRTLRAPLRSVLWGRMNDGKKD